MSANAALRDVETDEDFEAWRRVRIAVLPHERCPSAEELRRLARPEKRYLLASIGGEVVGCGPADRSESGGLGFVMPRVVPTARRRRAGTVMLRALAEHVAEPGFSAARSAVQDDGSLAFAERFGFRETGREVEQVRIVGPREPRPKPPSGIEIVSLAERANLLVRSYHELAVDAVRDIPIEPELEISLDDWARGWVNWREGTFVALAGDEVVGCAGLLRDDDQPWRGEHSLTAVRRDWRGRGLASTVKRTTIAWASGQGLRELYTWTQDVNEDMRRVNARLGYLRRALSITVAAELPLSI